MIRRWDDFTDVELVARLSSGEIEAAACLYDRYAPTLLALALRILRERSEAEDVVHDAFVTMTDRAGQYAPERGSVVAWLVTLVRNLSIDRARRRERRGVLLRSVVAVEPKTASGDPEELLSEVRLRAKVRLALAAIPDIQRATLELAFFEGLSYPEIAERERTPLGTIKSRAARALASLREALEEEEVDFADRPAPPREPVVR